MSTTGTTIERKIAPGSFLVQIDHLDPNHYKNPRREKDEPHIQEIQQSMRLHGQEQNLLVGRIEGSSLLAIIAGYTRLEAKTRQVYAPLIAKWNKDHNISGPTEAGHLVVNNPEHRKLVHDAYPAEYAAEVAKEDNQLLVLIDEEVKTAGQARVKSLVENLHRRDMCLADEIQGVEDLIADGLKANEVSKYLKKTEGQVSQLRRASKVIDALKTLLVTPDEGETLTEADLTSIKETAPVLIDELERRLKLPLKGPEAEQAISWSHLREFSQRVVPAANAKPGDKLPLTRARVQEFLCRMVGADVKSRKLVANRPPENYGLWLAAMKTAEEVTKHEREGKTAPVTPTPAPEAGSEAGKVSDLAEQQASGTPTAAPPTTPATPTAGATPEVSSGKPATPTTADTTMSTVEALTGGAAAEGDVDDEEGDAPPVPAGQKSANVQQAPTATAKAKDANLILKAAQTYEETAMEVAGEGEDPRACGRYASALLAAAALYEMVGRTEDHDRLMEAHEDYVESLELYIMGLEEYASKAVKKKPSAAFDMERPVVKLERIGDEFDGDDKEPTDADLQGLEGDDELAQENEESAEVEAAVGDKLEDE